MAHKGEVKAIVTSVIVSCSVLMVNLFFVLYCSSWSVISNVTGQWSLILILVVNDRHLYYTAI